MPVSQVQPCLPSHTAAQASWKCPPRAFWTASLILEGSTCVQMAVGEVEQPCVGKAAAATGPTLGKNTLALDAVT